MFDQILLPADDRAREHAAVEPVLDIAATHEAKLHVLHVADSTHDSVTRVGTDVVDVLEEEGAAIVDHVAERASDRGISTVTDVVQGAVPPTIVAYAEENSIDLITMPTRGRTGIGQSVVGSVTERVIRRVAVPVLTLSRGVETPRPWREILVPTDGSDCADEAVELAVALGDECGATLHLLSVVAAGGSEADPSDTHDDGVEDEAALIVSEAADDVERRSGAPVVTATDRDGSVADAIRRYVDMNDIDLLVAGTHGRTGVERYILGSVTETLVRTAPVPVLAVPRTELSG